MFKLIKKIHNKCSLKSRVAATFAIIASIICCAIAVQSKLSLLGCKSSMSIGEYARTGSMGILVLAYSFFIVWAVLLGTLSVPEAVKSFLASRMRRKAREKENGMPARYNDYGQLKENIKIIVTVVVGTVLLSVVIVGLGTTLGYIGWLIFC